MGKWWSIAGLACAGTMLAGCIQMTPATYTVSGDAKAALQRYQDKKVRVLDVEQPAGLSLMCRAVGDVKIADGMSVGAFVARAFNDEFKFAGIYGEGGATLRGTLTEVDFSSSDGLVGGHWSLALTLRSSNGSSLDVAVRHEFESGFNGHTGCLNTGLALSPAVHKLILAAIADPRFPTLLR